MRWVRTYTRDLEYTLATGRSVVIDPQHCEPFYLTGYNYTPLLEKLNDDTVVTEWDIALALEDRQRFEAHIAQAPGRVQVAPYRQYTGWCRPKGKFYGYVHRTPAEDGSGHFIAEGEPECILFGFGLVYIPYWITRALLGEMDKGPQYLAATYGETLGAHLHRRIITDVTFSYWHYAALGHGVPVWWDVRAVHLHYDVQPAGAAAAAGILTG